MHRTLSALVVLLLASLVPAHAQTAPTSGNLLQIDAVAIDKHGQPVTDLRQEEVEVWIGGRRIPMESFQGVTPAAGERPTRSITIIIDDVALSAVGLVRAKEIARRFVAKLSAGDQASVVALSGDVTQTTDDPTALSRRIDAIRLPATAFLRPEDLSAHVLKTLTTIARQVSEATARRRTIVAIGAGWLFDTPIPPVMTSARDLREEWTETVRAMASANVSLYVIDPGGVGMSPVMPTGGRSGFARDMGGHAFVNTNDAAGAVDQILRDTSTYYAMTVQDPPIFRTADVRELHVRTLRKGVTIRARQFIPGTQYTR